MSRALPGGQGRRSWGTDETGCSILHVDMDAFYASVEVARRPELRGRPVVVGGSGRSVVLAATYEARACGVHAAMPMTRARQLCPGAVVLPPDHAAYAEASSAVMELLGQVTAVVEQVSVDEAFLDVSGAVRRLGQPTAIGAAIRATIRRETGLPCSVGISSTKHVAKLASGLAKPDGLLLVPRSSVVELLHELPVQALWGVGDSTRDRLARWGITTVAQLAQAEVAQVQRAVGVAAGAHLHDLAWGKDPRPVVPQRRERSIGAETTFEVDTRDRVLIERSLLALADRTARQLRRRGLLTRTVSVKVRTDDWSTLTRSRTLPSPADGTQEIYRAARDLLRSVDTAGRPVRLVGIRTEGLSSATERQATLEEATADRAGAPSADRVADAVAERFGATAMRPAATLTHPRRPTIAGAERDLS